MYNTFVLPSTIFTFLTFTILKIIYKFVKKKAGLFNNLIFSICKFVKKRALLFNNLQFFYNLQSFKKKMDRKGWKRQNGLFNRGKSVWGVDPIPLGGVKNKRGSSVVVVITVPLDRASDVHGLDLGDQQSWPRETCAVAMARFGQACFRPGQIRHFESQQSRWNNDILFYEILCADVLWDV